MATEPVRLTGGAFAAAADEAPGWRAYYVFYHADRNRLLRHLVHPLFVQLLRKGAVDRFFFVRYALGGPHLRLRWRVTGEAAAEWAEAVLAQAAVEFFGRWPSPEAVPEGQIRKVNQSLLDDPMNRPEDDLIFPDNSWGRFPARFEVERYGGPDRLGASLDLFTVSSARVLSLVSRHGDLADWVRPAAMCATLHIAWGLAAEDEGALLDLVDYGPRLMGDAFARCVREAEAVFLKRRSQLMDMVRRELVGLTAPARTTLDGCLLAAAAGRLAKALDAHPTGRRWHLKASHLHMTANRLGLTNAEEVYLSRMLRLALDALRHEAPEAWQRLRRRRSRLVRRAGQDTLQALVASALAEIAAGGPH